LNVTWVAVALAILTLLFFHQVALEGQTFVAPDATAPVGFVRMGEKSLYQDHVYPLWNPFVFLGMPSFGSGAYNPLIYPPDWPLALAARWMRRGGLHHLGWLALAGGFQMLRGHAQIAFYTWLAVGLYVVIAALLPATDAGSPPPAATRWARAVSVLGAMAIAFGIAGDYNLPLRDYAQYSIRGGGADGGVGMEYATAWSLAAWELPAIVVAGWAGFGGATYWGGM